jgi:hypothetical protein
MRFILSMALVAAATSLVCHGHFHREGAEAALVAASSEPAFDAVVRDYPYSLAAVDAGRKRLELLTQRKPTESGDGLLSVAWAKIAGGLNHEKEPWITPPAAGAVALAALLLAMLMPGTRFRNLALMALVAGGLTLAPSFAAPNSQVALTEAFGPAADVIAWSPFIATGLMVLAAFALGLRRRND